MKSVLDKLFFRSNNSESIKLNLKNLSLNTPISKIFNSINNFSSSSEIRYVGGCVRKIINNEKVDDIDLATNLDPTNVCEALERNKIYFYKSGIKHGTITAMINEFKFEITSLREDIITDGRHAEVKFSQDWKKDSARRDFTINSIYLDYNGNIFDPYNGKEDLKKGVVKFIGNPKERIQEDYLRILRYIRFFLNYSKQKHNLETIKYLKMNLDGISKLSKERLLDEIQKIFNKKNLIRLSKDKISLEIIQAIFPEFKYFNIFSKLSSYQNDLLDKVDFIFFILLLIIDETDNTDYFLYKYNLSKKNQKRIKNVHDFYREKIKSNTFTEKNMNKIFYYEGKEAVIDILRFKLLKSKLNNKKLLELISFYSDMKVPILPIKADFLMSKFDISEGKILGSKIKMIEKKWVENNFQISQKQVENIINS